tara:strand:- start:14670 stop:15491 length:822 start_codon:yes stop_codon:yes gene_type:complete
MKYTGKSVLRYPGGKTRAVSLIMPFLTRFEAKVLVSPFFGGGSIEFAWAQQKPSCRVEGYDIYPPLVAFWREALSNPGPLSNKVDAYRPMDKDLFLSLQKKLPSLSGRDAAAAFYALNRSSFSGATMSGGMSPGVKRFTESSIQRLADFHAPNVKVRLGDVFDVVEDLIDSDPEDSVIYLDPPYKIDDSALYGHKGNAHRGFEHERLAELVHRLNGKGFRLVLSYNDSDSIRALYSRYLITPLSWSYGMKNVAGGSMGSSSELLILSEPFSTQ